MPDGQEITRPPAKWGSAIGLIAVGIVIGLGIARALEPALEAEVLPFRENTSYPLVSPLLACENGKEILSDTGARVHRSEIKKVIDDAKRLGNADTVSVYYRDLNTGKWLSINGQEHYAPASLFKVPYMMYLYKRSEDDPELLQRRLAPVPPDPTSFEYFAPAAALNASSTYSVEELIERMIVGSDNQALNTLFTAISPTQLNEFYERLSVHLPTQMNDDFVTVRDYSMFFRILYNASYLSEKNSQKALELLAKAEFRKGLMKWLPPSTTLADKFGERLDQTGGQHQLHDCGIVYVPKRPYFICVMTKGSDLDRMSNVIAGISETVYKQVADDLSVAP